MQRFILILLTLAIGLSLSFDADARRFGGGRSFGAAPMHQPRQSAPSTPSVAPAAPGRAMPGAGASRWLGPLAGLAAGGLLASLFMGGGFQGIQMFDVLIVALLGFIAFRFFVARRGAAPLQPVSGGGGAFQRQPLEQVGRDPVFGSASSPVPRAVINAPAWFNEQRFVEAARGHFQALQQHWDANEMDKIAAFVTPQMLQFLKQERADLGDGFQSTYIDDLDVQLDGLDDRADKTIATLTFRGISKTSRFDDGEVFSESWNMERTLGDNQPWLVAGIRQNA